MLVTVVVNVLNIIGNYSLIFGRFGFPELGVEGAAISTAFSRGVSMVILFVICSASISTVSRRLTSVRSLGWS